MMKEVSKEIAKWKLLKKMPMQNPGRLYPGLALVPNRGFGRRTTRLSALLYLFPDLLRRMLMGMQADNSRPNDI
jgi:hypothetical protein